MEQNAMLYLLATVSLLCLEPVHTTSPINIRHSLVNQLLDGYEATQAPVADGLPVTENVQLYILSIDSISDSSMDYDMSFYLRQRWYDPRLRFNESLGIENIELDPKLMDKIWVPDLYIINEKTAKFHTVTVPNKMMYIYPDGLVLYSARVSGVFSCMMDLHKYPLDKQICDIRMESYSHSASTLVVRWRDTPAEISSTLRLPQFDITLMRSFFCDQQYMGINYTCIGLDIHLERNIGYYLTQTYVPCVLVVILSWVNFWLSIDAVPARISLGLLTVLTMTTQSSAAVRGLTVVSYVKAMDVWIFACLFFVFAGLLEFAWVNVSNRVESRRKSVLDLPSLVNGNAKRSPKTESPTSQREGFSFTPSKNREKARNIDRVSRFLFPAAFILFNVGYWLVYLVLWEPVIDKHSDSEGVTMTVNLNDD
ncbi:glycine receptor subunit alpha-2-like [Crassostrea angulata]|uniref:glycine receptor subunit alpha-2-like n=1 Tax=Magallana angulata TaxID=2784310 RepID=UPI0022B18769|nr:glycine receptor subunit alpha-2-like [Crassostrea angulata]XP_052710420.1 glycine receptor subunit alpha-2-like [Crassostrea angulata]XP_052710421.1 glycine receptor subunit alpha-2-like [Crassostrea angulata]